VSALESGEGAGSANQIIGFNNASKTACMLTGYPGVAALNAQGVQVAQAQRISPYPSSTASVTLAPGQTASATVAGSEIPPGGASTCPFYAPAFLVTPPNLSQSVKVPVGGMLAEQSPSGFPGCQVIYINQVVFGTAG
jgi:hypothetical protein